MSKTAFIKKLNYSHYKEWGRAIVSKNTDGIIQCCVQWKFEDRIDLPLKVDFSSLGKGFPLSVYKMKIIFSLMTNKQSSRGKGILKAAHKKNHPDHICHYLGRNLKAWIRGGYLKRKKKIQKKINKSRQILSQGICNLHLWALNMC